MARSKIKVIEPELKNRCSKEDAYSIRELLGILNENGLTNLMKCKEDHRYRQGYLQALDDIDGIISKK